MKDESRFKVMSAEEFLEKDYRAEAEAKWTKEEKELAEKCRGRKTMSYEEIKAHLLKVAEIETTAKEYIEKAKSDPRKWICGPAIFYGWDLKGMIGGIVGRSAGWAPGHFFGTSRAYDIVYDAIYNNLCTAMPCHEDCLCW